MDISSTKQRLTSAQPAPAGTAFEPVGSLFAGYQIADAGGYITQEFQDFGYRLAIALDDMRHKSLYIKMAKEVPRGQLESALSYVSDAAAVKSKAKLFMWRLRQLQTEEKAQKKTIEKI